MADATIAAKKRGVTKKQVEKIPDYLIYEVTSEGKPIYYRGYKDVLNKTKTFEEITMESKLQAGLKAMLTLAIGHLLLKLGYQIATGELGLHTTKNQKGKRGADIAIFKSENWDWEASFSSLPPDIIIEIDTQAELKPNTEVEYISEKIKDYHAFGVQKVIWIFTKSKLVFVATSELPWLTYDWDTEIEVVKGVTFKVSDVLRKSISK